jgi:mannose-6-phosphate isomerase
VIVCPARLEPTFSSRPWGSLSLAPLFPEKTNLAELIGEAWMTGNESRFAGGPFAGRKLGRAWPEMPPEWAGTRVERCGIFPLLVKFIFTEDKLSVQVHPDDAYAARHEQAAGGRGKTEMWYVIRARAGAEMRVGLKPEVTREKFRCAIEQGNAEECLERVPVRAGDAIFVPAGTAHTIGPGLVLCEIQEHSDLTYRVYDYNRRDSQGRARTLHVEKALEVMRFGKQCGGKLHPDSEQRGGLTLSTLVACPYFVTEKWEFAGKISAAASPEHFDLLIFIEGNGTIHSNGGDAEYAPAQAWMLPAALGEYQLAPKVATALLRTWAPQEGAP